MMKINLHWKLTLIFCGALIFGLVIGYSFLSSQLKDRSEQNLKEFLNRQILSSRDLVESTLKEPRLFAQADRLARQIAQQQKLRVTILDQEGKVIGESDVEPNAVKDLENHIDRPEIQDAAKHGIGSHSRYSQTLRKKLLYIAIPFGQTNALRGFLRYAVPVAYIDTMGTEIKKTIGIGIGYIFLISLLIAHIFSIFVSRPLREIAHIASAMAQGDFSQKPLISARDEIGELAKALSLMSDEIKKKIERISQEDVKLEAVLSSMLEGVMVVDSDGKILLMNPSLRKIFFVDANPQAKTPLESIRHNQVQDIVDQILHKDQAIISCEIHAGQADEKILQINAVPMTRNNIIEGAVLVFHDISELRRLEKIRQDFVANVSHELRTPISSIKGYAETLLEGALNDKKDAREFVDIIFQDSNRLASLIDDLLDLAKIESGKMNMTLMPLKASQIIKTCLGILEKTIKDKKITITMNIETSADKVLADEKRLTQVFLNLLDNAVKYTPSKGSIVVSASPAKEFIQFDVSDTGLGIPADDLLRVFERFYRVDKARSRELGGTGLGLAIVKNIIVAHGGHVWVRSEPESGSTFSFTIPKA